MSFETEQRKDSQTPTPSPLETRDLVHPEKKARTDRIGRKGQIAIISLIAGGLAAGGGIFMKANSDNEAPTPEPKPTVEAPLVPGETPAAPEQTAEPAPVDPEVATPESLRLSAELPAEQLAQGSIDLLTDWRFADATDDTIEAVSEGWYAYDGGKDEYLTSIAKENADFYSSVLFKDDWQSNPDIVNLYNYSLDSNKGYIDTALARNSEEMPLITLTNEVSDVKEYSAVAEMDPKDITPIWEVVKEQINLGNARVISYTSTPNFQNSESADTRPYHVVQVFDITDGTARLITSTSAPIE